MNWATIAPETRLYKGKALFRWEVSPGLEHHCGTCATPLHNARAKTSCIGKHVEPCYRFHQQLHFVGKSHECFGCNSSDEMHHNRHKEILKITRQIAALDEPSSLLPPGKSVGGGKPRRASAAANSTNTATDTGSECISVDDSKVTRRERKKAKKAGNGNTKDRRSIEAFPKEETDFVSEAIHLSVHDSKGAWEGTYIYDHKQPAVEENAIIDEDDDDYDVENGASQFDSLSVKSPTASTPRQRKVAKKLYTPNTNHSGSRKFASQLANTKTDPYDGVDPDIFCRLGIEIVNPVKNSKARKELITKLVCAVKEDIEIIEREEAESVMREEGFWRWAGKAAYHTILETRKELDWATGQKRGAPRFEAFADDEMDPEGIEGIEGAEDTEVEEPKPKIELPIIDKDIEDDGFTIASRKKAPKKGDRAKKTKSVRRLPLAPQIGSLIIEEEEADDGGEMLRRYEQRLAGERNLGGGHSNGTPARKKGDRLTITVK